MLEKENITKLWISANFTESDITTAQSYGISFRKNVDHLMYNIQVFCDIIAFRLFDIIQGF